MIFIDYRVGEIYTADFNHPTNRRNVCVQSKVSQGRITSVCIPAGVKGKRKVGGRVQAGVAR